jgi:hypothetical protein
VKFVAENQVVVITFDRLAWAFHTELSGGGDPPSNHLPSLTPFIWIVFFKVDGTTVILNDAGMLVSPDGSPPKGLVFSAAGSHGDLGSKMTVGDVRGIPASIGTWTESLTPIAVPPNLVEVAGQSNFPATFGAAVVLNRTGGHIPEHAIEAGHQELVTAVGAVLTKLLQTLGPGNETITSDQIAAATAGLSSGVSDAVEKAMSIWEKLWAVSGEDSSIGQVILTWEPRRSREGRRSYRVAGFRDDFTRRWQRSHRFLDRGRLGELFRVLPGECDRRDPRPISEGRRTFITSQ